MSLHSFLLFLRVALAPDPIQEKRLQSTLSTDAGLLSLAYCSKKLFSNCQSRNGTLERSRGLSPDSCALAELIKTYCRSLFVAFFGPRTPRQSAGYWSLVCSPDRKDGLPTRQLLRSPKDCHFRTAHFALYTKHVLEV